MSVLFVLILLMLLDGSLHLWYLLDSIIVDLRLLVLHDFL